MGWWWIVIINKRYLSKKQLSKILLLFIVPASLHSWPLMHSLRHSFLNTIIIYWFSPSIGSCVASVFTHRCDYLIFKLARSVVIGGRCEPAIIVYLFVVFHRLVSELIYYTCTYIIIIIKVMYKRITPVFQVQGIIKSNIILDENFIAI